MKKLILLTIITVTFLSTTSLEAQIINGIIANESGEPLAGATVVIKGTSTETKTDFDGKFSIPSTDSCVVVIIYYRQATHMEAAFCAGKKNKLVFEKGGTLESSPVESRIFTSDDIKNLPTRRIGSIATSVSCACRVINEWDRIAKIKESQPDITTYYIDGFKASKEEVLTIPERDMKRSIIGKGGGTSSTIDSYNENNLSKRIELIRINAQL